MEWWWNLYDSDEGISNDDDDNDTNYDDIKAGELTDDNKTL